MTTFGKTAQGPHNRLHLFYTPFEIGNMSFRMPFHLPGWACVVAPESKQFSHFIQRKSKVARSTDELQYGHIGISIVTISIFAPRGGKKSDAFIIADHLCGDPRSTGGFTDVHNPYPGHF